MEQSDAVPHFQKYFAICLELFEDGFIFNEVLKGFMIIFGKFLCFILITIWWYTDFWL